MGEVSGGVCAPARPPFDLHVGKAHPHARITPRQSPSGGEVCRLVTWVRFDDQYPIHRKIAVLSDAAYRLLDESIFWCSRNGTDGIIRRDEVVSIGVRAKPKVIGELVRRDNWHTTGHGCPRCPQPIDGWVVHDYLDYQPTREQVEKERAAKAQRQKNWLTKRRSRDASLDGPQDASRDGSEDDAPLHTPPRPEGKRGGGPEALPAANGGRAAAGNGARRSTPRPSPKCPTCGNPIDSAYHRGACIVAAQLVGDGL